MPVVRERLALVRSAARRSDGSAALRASSSSTRARSTRVSALLEGRDGDRERLDALAVGGAMVGRDGVLVDTDNAPAVVLGRGRAHGLLEPASEPFALALLFGRLDTPFVAVPDPQSNAGANDRLEQGVSAALSPRRAGLSRRLPKYDLAIVCAICQRRVSKINMPMYHRYRI